MGGEYRDHRFCGDRFQEALSCKRQSNALNLVYQRFYSLTIDYCALFSGKRYLKCLRTFFLEFKAYFFINFVLQTRDQISHDDEPKLLIN